MLSSYACIYTDGNIIYPQLMGWLLMQYLFFETYWDSMPVNSKAPITICQN